MHSLYRKVHDFVDVRVKQLWPGPLVVVHWKGKLPAPLYGEHNFRIIPISMESPRSQRKKDRETHLALDNILALSEASAANANPVIQL